MNRIFDLRKSIKRVKAKLKAEGIDLNDCAKAIKCLKRTVAPVFCVRIYKEYILNKRNCRLVIIDDLNKLDKHLKT